MRFSEILDGCLRWIVILIVACCLFGILRGCSTRAATAAHDEGRNKLTTGTTPQSRPPIDLKLVRRVYWVNPNSCGDAFMLMKYASKDGRIVEYLWNSRDGVTPFGIMAQDDETELQHVDWHNDIYCPTYVPAVGMRIFVRLTRERALEHARANVARWWEDNNGFRERFPDREKAIEHFAESYVSGYGGDSPDIITVTQERLDEYQAKSAPQIVL